MIKLPLDQEEILKKKAYQIRCDIVKMLSNAGSGHLGGSLGLADIFSCLYFSFLKHRSLQPDWIERDRLILSIGHVAPVLYATLAHAGYFETQELLTLRKIGSRLQGHPSVAHKLPGIELAAGSLGQGLSVSVGMALALKSNQSDSRTICIMGDGELQEGSVWEAAMSASHYKLNNLIGIVDRNRLQIDGATAQVMQLEPLSQKWESFGWQVLEINGNHVSEILNALENARNSVEKPTVILSNSIMGKGIPEIENNYQWHGKAPDKAEAERFLQALKNSYEQQR
jgi:transketolase